MARFTLTSALSHPMGEGDPRDESLANERLQTFAATQTTSPSPIGWERAGVRVSGHLEEATRAAGRCPLRRSSGGSRIRTHAE